MSRVVVATGVTREAACLQALRDVVAIPGGGDPVGLRARIEAAAVGAKGIASFGMAGALAPDLAIGDWVVADRLVGAVEVACDPAWRDALAAVLPGARVGPVFADGRMIASVAGKRELGRRHGALAVDMESHVAAAVARERGLPFAIVRCISDRWDHVLPPAIAVAMRPDGGLAIGAMLRSLAASPGQIGDLARVTRSFATAMSVLRRDAALLGPRLSLPDQTPSRLHASL